MSFFFGKGRSNRTIPQNATFRLTEQGRDKITQEFGSDKKSLVLVALESRGTSDVGEIAESSGLSKGEVERMVPVLVRQRYIQYTGADVTEGE